MEPALDTGLHLNRQIGLVGATALVVGGVIGAGIYVMVAEIGALAGYASWLAFAAAMLMSLVGVLPLIQTAGALPQAGAGYFFCSRLLSPYWGVLMSYWVILGGGASTTVVAVTLARYAEHYVSLPVPTNVIAGAIVLAFYGVYTFGLRLAMPLQIIMTLQFLLALLLYAGAGVWDTGLEMDLVPPHGLPAFLMAVLLSYSTCMGFQVIAEMGEEIKEPRKNIPLALLIGGAIVSVIYILVVTVFVVALKGDGDAMRALKAPLTISAEGFLPPALIGFLSLGAITAALTSLNAGAIAIPREWFAQARDGIAPHWLGAISPRTRTPQHAVTAFMLWVLMLLALGQSMDFYGYCAAIGILVLSSAICLAALRLPKRFPKHLARAYIRFPQGLMWGCAIVTLLVTLVFVAVIAIELPSVLALYAFWTLAVSVGYRVKTRTFSPAQWAALAAVPEVED
ncbi:MAG: APC family permease [Candidatus Hydrogenedentes bacterium]|nr:APC family permease [Candidatus Hydrogenedentota bacterium]